MIVATGFFIKLVIGCASNKKRLVIKVKSNTSKYTPILLHRHKNITDSIVVKEIK